MKCCLVIFSSQRRYALLSSTKTKDLYKEIILDSARSGSGEYSEIRGFIGVLFL